MNLVQKGAGTGKMCLTDSLLSKQTWMPTVPGGWSLGPLAPRPCVAMLGAVGAGTRGWSPGVLLTRCEKLAGA